VGLSFSFSLKRLELPLTPNSSPLLPIESPTKPSHHHHHVGAISVQTTTPLGSHPFPRVTCNPPFSMLVANRTNLLCT